MALKDIHLGGHPPDPEWEGCNDREGVVAFRETQAKATAVVSEQLWRERALASEKRAEDLAQEVENYRSTHAAVDAEARRLAARVLVLEEQLRVERFKVEELSTALVQAVATAGVVGGFP